MYTLKKHQEKVDQGFNDMIPFMWKNITERPDNKKAALVLQAPTGAGKTISIGNVLVNLVNGGYQGLNKGPILFVSASPDLNIQTLKKIEKAYPILRGKITFIENDFNETQLKLGHIYFINTQKLGKNKTLTKGDAEGSHEYNFWEVWEKACLNEAAPAVLVIDESHQGMGGNNETIAKRLLQGKDKTVPVPFIIGVSATPSKFEKLIQQTHYLEKIEVDMREVKDSGLIKEIINIHYKGEQKGDFESILLSTAASEYVKYEDEWKTYCDKVKIDPVIPLLVVQVRDHITEQELLSYAMDLSGMIPSIDNANSFAHNITGLPQLIDAQGVKIHHVDPSDVQDDERVQVFFVKESAAVGWDCPRAEVLLSYRPHSDDDYIIQIIGRMLRTPLAQRVEGSEILNSTSVILPFYDIEKVESINDKLRHGGVDGIEIDEDEDVIEVSLNPVLVTCVNDTFKDILESLTSFTSPNAKHYDPVSRMLKVGLDLTKDKIIEDYEEDVIEDLSKEINALIYKHSDEINKNIEDLKVVKTEQQRIDADGHSTVIVTEHNANAASIQKYLEDACKVFGTLVAQEAVKEYMRSQDAEDDDAMMAISAAGYSDSVVEELNEYADKKVKTWLTQELKRDIKKFVSQERASIYNAYLSQSSESLPMNITLPEKFEINSSRINNGQEEDLPYIEDNKHMYSDDEGRYYHALSTFETTIIEKELEENGVVGFYRNPSTGSRSLKIPYVKDGVTHKVFAPDFIVFTETHDGVKASIVDPHGTYLEDSLDKLQGLALYAEQYGDQYVEIRALSDEQKGIVKVLELTDAETREHVLNSENIAAAYDYENAQELKIS